MKIYPLVLALFLSHLSVHVFGQNNSGQKTDSIEVFIVDSYVPPENPNKFYLSFYTSAICKSKLIIEKKAEFPISNGLTDNHRTEVDIAKLNIKKNILTYMIQMEDSNGVISTSEVFDLELYRNDQMVEPKTNYFFSCLVGGIVFLMPSVTVINSNGKIYYGLNKELPIVSIHSGGFNYPSGYLSVEYAHILKAERKNYLRLGYKHIYEIPKLEYISAGLSGFTDFRGLNGISPEISLGMIKLYNVFTLYTRYRYNFTPGKKNGEFSEVSLGLYSSFFTFHW